MNKDMILVRCLRCAVLIIAVVAVAAGCANDNSSDNPYKNEIAKIISSTKSDYVKTVLSDGTVTAEEVRDSQQKVVKCLADAGVFAEYIDYGYGYKNFETTSGIDKQSTAALEDCDSQWDDGIQSIYMYQVINPKNEDMNALIARCLVRKNLVPEPFSGANYRELSDSNGINVRVTAEQDPIEVVQDVPSPEVFLPGGVSMNDPRVMMCEANPSK